MTPSDKFALEIEATLVSQHGPLLPPSVLPGLLGYCSIDAYRKAVSRRTVPVAIFKLENRRGNFALAKDVARWLSQQRMRAAEPEDGVEPGRSVTITLGKTSALARRE